jgi:dihydroceramide fatty acyl 2-hydroxylase
VQPPVPVLVALFAAGVGAWSLLEYAIHGWLSHRFATPAATMHWSHHRDPRRVFTSVIVWAPAALAIYGLLALAIGGVAAVAIVLGVLTGFLRYERVHWRIHFRAPRNAREERRRVHHLSHHLRDPRAYHGVTTRVWDRVFGTLPAHHRDDYARVARQVPLAQPLDVAPSLDVPRGFAASGDGSRDPS